MSSDRSFSHKQIQQITGNARYRLKPIAGVVAGMALLLSNASYAADPSVADLQNEIAQLKQIIAAQKAELDKQGTTAQAAPATVAPAPAPAPQQDESKTLGEITVSGAPPIAALQDTPISQSIVSGKELAQTGAASLAAITQRLANVTWNVGNQRTTSVSVRGIGKIGQTEAQEPSVGVTIDGVSYAFNPLVSAYDFADVDTASVIRGPQGTAGGKSTSAGAVNITTNRPSFTPSADYSLTFGQEGTFIGKLAAGGPIIDNVLAWRGAFTVNRGDGNLLNLYNNDTSYQNTDRLSGTVQFLFTPSKDFNARFSLNVQPTVGEAQNGAVIYLPPPTTYSNGSTNALANGFGNRLSRSWFTNEAGYSYNGTLLYGAGQNAVDLNAQQAVNTSTRGASAELNWNLGQVTLTSLTAMQDYYFNAVNDEGTPFDINTNSGGNQEYYRQISQELRITSQPGKFVDYQAGIYLLKDTNNDYYNKAWGSDAGAFFATNAQYKILDATAAGQLLMQNSLDRLSMLYNSPAGVQDIENKDAAVYAQADWHLTDKATVKTGLRFDHDERTNTGSTSIIDNGYGVALNPVSVNGVNTGGFATTSTGTLAPGNSAAQLSLADSVAAQYFGVKATGTPGAAYNSLTAAQQLQVTNAQALRKANIGVLFPQSVATYTASHLPTATINPSYKFNDNYTAYASWQYGQKTGVAQFINGAPNIVQPERTNAFELGLKSVLLDQTLLLNADIFLMNINNYQQSVKVVDTYNTALQGSTQYTAATGNVPQVRAEGLEIDAFYTGIKNTTLRFSGAYNNAYYVSFPNSAQPAENSYTGAAPYQDVSGRQLPGNSKLIFNLGGDYRAPVWGGHLFHTSFNTQYESRYNSDPTLSQYSWIPSHSVTDWSIGLANAKQNFDVSLIAKNLFNNATPQAITFSAGGSTSATSLSYTPPAQRWLGLQLSGKL